MSPQNHINGPHCMFSHLRKPIKPNKKINRRNEFNGKEINRHLGPWPVLTHFDGLNFIQGDGHGSQVTGLKQTSGSQMASVGMDDSLKMFDQTTNTYLGGNNATKLKAQPRGLDHKGNLTVITTVNSITMVR